MGRFHKPPRGLSADEAEAWSRVAKTVTPMHPQVKPAAPALPAEKPKPNFPPPKVVKRAVSMPSVPPRPADKSAPPRPTLTGGGLDSHWDRRIAKGTNEPDFTLDLHGHTLDSAHRRLNDGLAQAKAMGARMVLVITGKPRPAHSADRGERRGAIRAKMLDWLAAGPHEGDIAAIRNAHRRHGGEGALYVVLRRR